MNRGKENGPIEVHGQKFHFSKLAKVGDGELFGAICCQGAQDIFRVEEFDPDVPSSYEEVINSETGALHWMRKQELKDRRGIPYTVIFKQDLDNRSVEIAKRSDTGNLTVSRLNIRDRSYDGMPESTSPRFLNTSDVPARSGFIGGTLWDYSNPNVDRQLPGRSSVEISRVSSDPERIIFDRLAEKEEKLYDSVTPNELSRFIDDPFVALPFADPSKDSLSHWYKLWWQVVNRGIRGKEIAYPGQVSERGFKNFSPHVLKSLPDILDQHGYSYISSVPTWAYVWKMNINGSGFSPDNLDQHDEAIVFFDRLGNVELPVTNDNGNRNHRRVRELSEKDPVISWLSVVPFALQLDPNIQPKLDIKRQHQEAFDELFSSIKDNIVMSDGSVSTYPLSPSRNLWHSKKIDNTK